MRIGLISDTHLLEGGPGLAPQVYRAFAGVELILHCGDLETLAVLDLLEEIAEVKAVRGHGDPQEPGHRLADRTRILEVEGVRIAMVHDLEWPPPIATRDRATRDGRLLFPPLPLEEVLRLKFGQIVDVVAFGDTHEELVESHGGILFVNPGSPTYPGIYHRMGSLGTVALLEVAGGEVSAKIVELADLDSGAVQDSLGTAG